MGGWEQLKNAFVGGSPNLWSYVILDAYVLLVILLENQKTGSYPQRSHKRGVDPLLEIERVVNIVTPEELFGIRVPKLHTIIAVFRV